MIQLKLRNYPESRVGILIWNSPSSRTPHSESRKSTKIWTGLEGWVDRGRYRRGAERRRSLKGKKKKKVGRFPTIPASESTPVFLSVFVLFFCRLRSCREVRGIYEYRLIQILWERTARSLYPATFKLFFHFICGSNRFCYINTINYTYAINK